MTGYTVNGAGSTYATTAGTVGTVAIAAGGLITTGTPALTNPEIQTGVFSPRPPMINVAVIGTVVSSTGLSVVDGGLVQRIPPLLVLTNLGTAVTTNATITATVGGVTDTSYVIPV